jgi:hypothetical protein
MSIILDGTSGITSPNETITGSLNTPNTFGFKNRIINGGMVIDQRNAGASVTPTVSASYNLDRWQVGITVASKFSVQQNAGSVTPPVGFTKYLGCTSLSAYSVLTGDTLRIQQPVEGFNIADLAWGTANAATVTLSFWVRSSLTGTFGGSIFNSAATRSYPFSYSIPIANTWTSISITIVGETTGVWATDNTQGLNLSLSLGTGATYSSTAGAWANGLYTSATGATSVVGTSGATFYITGVQLEKGSVATSFDQRAYSQELAMCQRYYQASRRYHAGCTTSSQDMSWILPVLMRAIPTLTVVDIVGNANKLTTSSGNNIAFNAGGVSATTDSVVIQSNTISIYVWYEFYTPLNAEL